MSNLDLDATKAKFIDFLEASGAKAAMTIVLVDNRLTCFAGGMDPIADATICALAQILLDAIAERADEITDAARKNHAEMG